MVRLSPKLYQLACESPGFIVVFPLFRAAPICVTQRPLLLASSIEDIRPSFGRAGPRSRLVRDENRYEELSDGDD